MDKIKKIHQEIERRRLHFNKEAEKYEALNYGYSQNCYGARDALRDIEIFLDTLSEEPDKSVEEEAEVHSYGYDEDYLNEKIAKASKSWEGVDVDKFMDEVRGREPEQPNLDDIKRECYYKGYLKGRQEAHIPAWKLGLPKRFDFKPLYEDLD